MRFVFRLLGMMALLAGIAAPVNAEVTNLRLPADCADFALDPDTGTLAAVVMETSSVLLFRAAAWQAGSTKPAATLAVGAAPWTIAFKRFKNRRVFVVGCRDDSHIYVFDADDGAVVKKIPVPSPGVWHVAASANPDDPFVYFNVSTPGRSGGVEPHVHAISLKTLDDLGAVTQAGGVFMVSASGEVGYQREVTGRPGDLQCSLRVSDGAAAKPEFVSRVSQSAVTADFIPDPFDRYTANGNRIFTRGMERTVAKFDFIPRCWFRTRPLVVGVIPDEPQRIEAATLPVPPSRVTMRAASSNTLRPVGDAVVFDLRPEAKPGAPGGADAAGSDAKTVARLRMFAYDPAACVLYARRSHLAVVPLADFHAGDEPFLTATLGDHPPLFVGSEAVLTLTPAEPRVTARIEWMPEGMRVSGSELRWQPAADQVGPNKIVVSLAHGGLEQTQTFTIPVQRPSLKLPFAPVGCAVTEDGRTAVIWDVADDEPWRPRAAPTREFAPRMATIDITTGAVRADKRIPDAVRRAVVLGERVFLLAPGANRCDVVDLMTLDRRATLETAGPIVGVGRCDGAIVIQSPSAWDVFDETMLAHRRRYGGDSPGAGRGGGIQAAVKSAPPTMLTSHGLVVEGVLLDAVGKPALLHRPAIQTVLPRGDQVHEPAFLRSTLRTANWQSPAVLSDRSGTFSLASNAIPRGNATASLTEVVRERARLEGQQTSGWDFELKITADGDPPLSVVLDRQVNVPLNPAWRAAVRAAVCGSNEGVCATFGSRMYSVPLPPAGGGAESDPPVLTPRQSALVLDPDRPTVLRHFAEGGRPPLSFSLVTAASGVSIDQATGAVTMDRAAVLEAAAGEVEKMLTGLPQNASRVEAYRRLVADVGERVAAIIGGKTAGLPVLVPIHVAVTDAAGRTDSLRYHVVAEIPDSRLMPKMQKIDEYRLPLPSQPGAADGPAQQPGDLPGRIDALEQRLDLVTRQLNQILKRLDK